MIESDPDDHLQIHFQFISFLAVCHKVLSLPLYLWYNIANFYVVSHCFALNPNQGAVYCCAAP